MSKVKILKDEHRYSYYIVLDKHPDHINNRDPRRVWQYSCCTGKHSAEEYDPTRNGDMQIAGSVNYEYGDRIYYFENEQDMLMFNLRWQNSTN